MKKDKKKIKEPFEPGNTPEPPQIKEPNSGRERENPIEEKGRPDNRTEENKTGGTRKAQVVADDSDTDDKTKN